MTRLSKQEKREIKFQRLKEKYKNKPKKRSKRQRTPEDQKHSNYQIAIEILHGNRIMTHKEMKSLSQQIRYIYSCNRLSNTTVNIIISNCTQIEEYLTEDRWNWNHIHWVKEQLIPNTPLPPNTLPDAITNTTDKEVDTTETDKEEDITNTIDKDKEEKVSKEEDTIDNDVIDKEEEVSKYTLKKDLKYQSIAILSADATDTLTELDENTLYLIGGLVDRNRYKNYLHTLGNLNDIKTYKLPLPKLNATSALSTLSIFGILSEYISTANWESAIEKHLPTRKLKESMPMGIEKEKEERR
ncbi:tRNA (guanine9-N1)-methyltransferase [Nematocida sp. AWRm80]|nr:tRNA (guanine9-N1)-methyltransferase [Nematocida sp. AWRm80]